MKNKQHIILTSPPALSTGEGAAYAVRFSNALHPSPVERAGGEVDIS